MMWNAVYATQVTGEECLDMDNITVPSQTTPSTCI